MSHLVKILLVVGGLNWGLIGVGLFLNKDWNFLALLSAFDTKLPAIIYSVVGVAAIWAMFKRN